MSAVVFVVIAALFAAMALFMLSSAVLTLLQGPRRAVERLRKDLAKAAGEGRLAEISPATAYPLSVEMIREAAELDGYQYVDVYRRNGMGLLRFRLTEGTHHE
ncbi:hypothetical protein EV191_110216 [Tamaricihabitans halophyticus]|uniref:Uncharacterized protein n=1 Tax=Tamaricihabitans halophyticus TaxID=1262583 RepID=A0A4R2QNL4_9PSEU|nr:hypothetical protein [Tamaricihabitans halophyticus]TCP48655.1 hypothetical protein EV191_110216 [Tamaricihabitans halophyticus]